MNPSGKLSFIQNIQFDGDAYERFIWHLQIMAVDEGIKPSFFYAEGKTTERTLNVMRSLGEIGFGTTYGYGRKFNNISPVEINRQVSGEGHGIWAFKESNREYFMSSFSKYSSGLISQGEILGYPSCCVTWFANDHEKPIGNVILDELKMAGIYSPSRQTLQEFVLRESTFELVKRALLSDLGKKLKKAMRISNTTFPFIPHLACPDCISDKTNSPSAKMNSDYSNLALSLNPAFHKDIIRESRLS